ncbi:MAG: VOC family protein [Phycisphaerae bacterium]|nr:VOC family protein [Phycisphaerae bacterium]
MLIQPHLNFEGRCDEAIAFYRMALGAQVTMLMRYKDIPVDPDSKICKPSAESAEKVCHAALRVGETVISLTDGRNLGKPVFNGIMLSLSVRNDAEARQFYTALSTGGTVVVPLGKTFFSSSFGMVTDRFGVCWMVLVAH